MRYWFVILFLGVVLSAQAQQDTLFNQTDAKGRRTGFWRRYYSNGKVAYTAQFDAGRNIGRMVRYDETGQRRVEVLHRKDGHHADAKLYSPEGKLIAQGIYYDQKKDSTWRYFGEKGQVVQIENWKRGAKEGEELIYSDEGQVAQRLHWKNGKQDGAQELYYATGALRIRWNMVQDVVEGEMATFFTTGAKRLAGNYVKGKREGYWTTWDIDGRIEDQTEYRNGIATNAAERARQQDSILEALFNNAGKIPELDADERLNY